jgi:uncharacterized protein YkwD/enterochelin esterase-like enzyme
MSGAYVRFFEHTSELLRGNPMGNAHVRRVPVYLPPDYDSRRPEPYPVVFMLAGWPGRGAGYLGDAGAFGELLVDKLDALIAGRQMPGVIVVFPDCSTRLGGSQYVNSSANGPFMDYLCEELVEWVDDRFHTHRSREYRGLCGHSSGGFGALVTGMLRPERFGSVCSSAGDCWFENLYLAPLPTVIRVLDRAGGVEPFVQRFLASPNPMGISGREEVITMLTLSMCSCFAPNPEVPLLGGDLYFDVETAEVVPDVWRRFRQWDPLRLVDQHVTALSSLRWIHLEAANEDEFGLHLGHRRLARKLEAHHIPHRIEEYPGRHGGHHHRMPERLRRMLEAMRLGGAKLALLLVLFATLAVAPIGCSSGSAPAGSFGNRPPQVHATAEIAPLERAMFERVNQDRRKHGLAPLVYDERLADVGRAHCADMLQSHFFSHESPNTGTLENRLDAAGYLALEARENLASAPNIDRAEDNLLASPGHRANLLAPSVTHIGIGIMRGDATTGDPSVLTITQVFAKPAEALSAANVVSTVTSSINDARRSAGLGPLAADPYLDELARRHLDELPVDLDGSAVGRVGQRIASELSADRSHGLKTVEISAQIVLSSSQFDVPAAAKKAEARRLGVGAATITDERGRPAVKVLALVGH